MKRRVAVVGDRLSTGGHVLNDSGAVNCTYYGHRAALIGGGAYCEVCKTTGEIAKAGGPGRRRWRDREIALDSDIVLCRCEIPPHIGAVLSRETWHEDGGVAHDDGPLTCYGEQYELKDAAGRPLAGVRYRVRTNSETVLSGVTDASGRTGRVNADSMKRLYFDVMD